MVALVRREISMRAVARRFHVSLPTVQRWVKRAQGHRLDCVDWREHSSRPHHMQWTAEFLEELVRCVRQELKEQSDLGESGAAVMFRALAAWTFVASLGAEHVMPPGPPRGARRAPTPAPSSPAAGLVSARASRARR
jgi:transposase